MIVWAVVPPGNDERSSSCGRVSVTEKKRRGKGAKNDCPPTQKKRKADLWIKKQVPVMRRGGRERGFSFFGEKRKKGRKRKVRRGEGEKVEEGKGKRGRSRVSRASQKGREMSERESSKRVRGRVASA